MLPLTTPTTARGHAVIGMLAALLSLLVLPVAARGQDGFLFQSPRVGLTLRAGPGLHTTGGDVFDQFRRDLTLGRGDFAAAVAGAELLIMPSSRLDIALGVSHSQSRARSEFHDWIGEDDEPIEQVTRLQTVPLTASLRYQLVPRGRRIGSMAWLPNRTAPYIGAGGGVAFYRLSQDGEFVDFADDVIFPAVFESSGAAPVVHGLAGLDHWFTPRLGVNAEVRYTWGRAAPQNDFGRFDTIDVGSLQATLGFSVRW